MLAINVSIPNVMIARLRYLGWLRVTQNHLQCHHYQATCDF